jgi:membrane protein YdbS with pleckstrin-like domain
VEVDGERGPVTRIFLQAVIDIVTISGEIYIDKISKNRHPTRSFFQDGL